MRWKLVALALVFALLLPVTVYADAPRGFYFIGNVSGTHSEYPADFTGEIVGIEVAQDLDCTKSEFLNGLQSADILIGISHGWAGARTVKMEWSDKAAVVVAFSRYFQGEITKETLLTILFQYYKPTYQWDACLYMTDGQVWESELPTKTFRLVILGACYSEEFADTLIGADGVFLGCQGKGYELATLPRFNQFVNAINDPANQDRTLYSLYLELGVDLQANDQYNDPVFYGNRELTVADITG